MFKKYEDIIRIMMSLFFNSQTLKMISQVESFLYPDKQGSPEDEWRIQQPKCFAIINNNKVENNSPENHTQNMMRNYYYYDQIKSFFNKKNALEHGKYNYNYNQIFIDESR